MPASEAARFWAQKAEDRKQFTSDIRITQPTYFNIEFDSSIADLYEIELSEEEMEEGVRQWANTLIGSVIDTEVTTENMKCYVQAKWRHIATPTVTKVAGIFLFQFHSATDMMEILEGPTSFVFDKPLMLKQYEAVMVLGNQLFNSCLMWLRFPRLGF